MEADDVPEPPKGFPILAAFSQRIEGDAVVIEWIPARTSQEKFARGNVLFTVSGMVLLIILDAVRFAQSPPAHSAPWITSPASQIGSKVLFILTFGVASVLAFPRSLRVRITPAALESSGGTVGGRIRLHVPTRDIRDVECGDFVVDARRRRGRAPFTWALVLKMRAGNEVSLPVSFRLRFEADAAARTLRNAVIEAQRGNLHAAGPPRT